MQPIKRLNSMNIEKQILITELNIFIKAQFYAIKAKETKRKKHKKGIIKKICVKNNSNKRSKR